MGIGLGHSSQIPVRQEVGLTISEEAFTLPVKAAELVSVLVMSFRFLCDSQKELDELLDCLHPQGIRESQLKERLQKR